MTTIDLDGTRGRASKTAVQHHYDVGNDFYALWLDPSMTYSCALWEDGDDALEAAQERKLDLALDWAGVTSGDAVLDIGCGWGSLLRRLVSTRAPRRAVGLTLSDAQAAWVTGDLGDRVQVEVRDWSEHEPAGGEPYDAIVSIGAFEHFASPGRSRNDKVRGYRDFFLKARDLTRPGARMYLQSIVVGDSRLERGQFQDLLFILSEIYPQSTLPFLADMLRAAEGVFRVQTLRLDGEHYARTCGAWLERLRDARDNAGAVTPEVADTFAKYERYLLASERMFAGGQANLSRVAFSRV